MGAAELVDAASHPRRMLRYPRGGKCTASELGEYACRMTKDTNRFVFYLYLVVGFVICWDV